MKSVMDLFRESCRSIRTIDWRCLVILLFIILISNHAFAQRAMRWGDTLGVDDEVRIRVKPPEISIDDVRSDDTSASIGFITSFWPPVDERDYLDFWRKANWPIYAYSDIDSSSHLITSSPEDRLTSDYYFFDYFSDSLWEAYDSRGIGDPDVNYFYVATAVDSYDVIIKRVTSQPSNCVAEYDQRLKSSYAGTFNIISYPVDHGYEDAIDLVEDIPTASFFKKFVPSTQTWINRAMKFGASWIPLGDVSIDVGGVYGIVLDGSESEVIFSTNNPGNIAAPGASCILFAFPSGWEGLSYNWMMAPFYYCDKLQKKIGTDRKLYFSDLGEDIGRDVARAIRVWNPKTQSAINKTIYIDGWGWLMKNPVTPGQPMAIMSITSTESPWPNPRYRR